MSTNIKVQRICQHCGEDFIARTTVTQYCGDRCAKLAYKARKKAEKIETSNAETKKILARPIEEIKIKEFLTVRDIAKLLNCSRPTVYRLISNGRIYGINLAQRKTTIPRSEIDKLFSFETFSSQVNDPGIEEPEIQFDIDEWYHVKEVQNRFGISESALRNLIKRMNIPKVKNAGLTYVPKNSIDNLFK
jgi:excisionase family DNA binding protein